MVVVDGVLIGNDRYPSEYYQTPTLIEAPRYVTILRELEKRGDTLNGVVHDVICLFEGLVAGHKKAYDYMIGFPTESKTYRDWLTWRVVYMAIQYFSRLWRTDSEFLEYNMEYLKYVDEGIMSHEQWKK